MAVTGFTSSNKTPSYFKASTPIVGIPGFQPQAAGIGPMGYAGYTESQWGNQNSILDAFGAPKKVVAAENNSGALPNINTLTNNFAVPTDNNNPPPQPTPEPTYNLRGTTVTGSGQDALSKVGLSNSDYNQFSSEFNNDPSAFLSSIDSQFSQQDTFLTQNENALRAAQDAFNKTIEADYQTNLSAGSASKQKAVSTLNQNTTQAEQRKQDALNSAKQLYNQMQTGYRQRFGGASSAGEAANTILGEEQQRQSGSIGRDYMNTVSQIESQKADVENNYQTAIKELETQKQTAMRDVQTNFLSNLQQINNNRTISVAAKEEAKRAILLQARNEQFSISQNATQFEQNVALMREQATIQLNNTLKTGQSAITGNQNAGQNAINQFGANTQNLTSQLGQGNTTKSINTVQSQPQSINNAIGTIDSQGMNTNTGKNWWEQ